MSWKWLTAPKAPYRWGFVIEVLIKAALIFVLINALFAALYPLDLNLLGRISIYNGLVPGRVRLPYGENPEQSYNLSLQDLDAMFASHVINGAAKAPDEYRVLLIGDSSVWGILLDPEETLSGVLNASRLRTAQGKRIRVFNLGYPVQSLLKDVLILQYALRYQPDLVVWLVTPESFAPQQQLITLIARENPELVRALISNYNLNLDPRDPQLVDPDFFGKTIIGQRRALADWLRLQYYGLMWGATGHDQTYPRFYEPRMEDFDTSINWHGLTPDTFKADALAFDVLRAGVGEAAKAGVPLLLVDEPMFISRGKNSDVRYNFFYPRWLADRFRDAMNAQVSANNWHYIDLWNTIDPEFFTDSAVHINPEGTRTLAGGIGAVIQSIANQEMLTQRQLPNQTRQSLSFAAK